MQINLHCEGGTAFHKLFLPEPLRYSEDLDYVRTEQGGIGDVMKRLTSLGRELGFTVRTKMGRYPKLYWRFAFSDGKPGKIKIEIDVFERSPILGFEVREHSVKNPFFSGSAPIRTFEVEELIATKIRALYQRKKGRDLYDIWLALTELQPDLREITTAFSIYRPEGVSGEMLRRNFGAKLDDVEFLSDVQPMLKTGSMAYDPLEAARLVNKSLLSRL